MKSATVRMRRPQGAGGAGAGGMKLFGALLAAWLGMTAPLLAQGPARMKVRRWRVEGVTALDKGEVDAIVRPSQGKSLTLAQMKQTARRISAAYEARGYVMAYAYVPPQKFQDGVVLIKVQEGKIGKVKVEGNYNYSEKLIRRFMEPALESPIVHQPSLQRALLTLNQFMDLRVQSVLDAKKNGTVDVILKAKDSRPLHAILDYDNFGARLVGENRVGAGAMAANAVTDGDLLAIKYVFPIDEDASDPFAFVNYSLPLDNSGIRLETSYAHARTSVGQELAVLGIEGDAEILNVRGVLPDTLTTFVNSSWTAELVMKQVLNTGLDKQLFISEDDVRALGVGHRGTMFSRDSRTQFAHNVTFFQGTGKGLGGSEKGDAFTSRSAAGADNEFSKATVEAVVIQKLGKNTFALGRVSGQVADDALMVPEQFALGGPDSVRGFEQGEFLGDNGYTVAAELRQLVLQSQFSQLQLLGFVDHGDARIERPLVGERSSLTLTSAGVGMRAQLGRKVSARADVGFPIDPKRNTAGDAQKLHAQVSCRF